MSLSNQLELIIKELWLVSTETTLMLGAIVLLGVGLMTGKVIIHKGLYLITLIFAMYCSLYYVGDGAILTKSLFLNLTNLPFQFLLILSLGLILIYPRDSKHSVEFYFLMLAIGVGALFLIKANNLLIIYLSIELVSFVSYVLTGFSFKRQAHEAAIKYLLFGAISSAFLLFGIGILYGGTGTIYLSEWDFGTFDLLLNQVGLLFLLFGLFFKIAIFPFHAWTPATYQGAPLDAVVIVSIVPKIAGLLALKRILIDASIPMDHWIIMGTLGLGIMTILVGTLGALRQQNVRRMISFGAIAHSGFMLPFAMIVGNTSEQAFWSYAFIYTLMNIITFYLVGQYESKGIIQNSDFGNASKSTITGVLFTLILVSLIGLPPLAGFTVKFFLFSTLWENYIQTGLNPYLTYLMVAVLATVASVFYYFRIPYYHFIAEGSDKEDASIKFSSSTKIIATIFTIVLLLLFFAPKLIVMMHTLLKMRS